MQSKEHQTVGMWDIVVLSRMKLLCGLERKVLSSVLASRSLILADMGIFLDNKKPRISRWFLLQVRWHATRGMLIFCCPQGLKYCVLHLYSEPSSSGVHSTRKCLMLAEISGQLQQMQPEDVGRETRRWSSGIISMDQCVLLPNRQGIGAA